MMKELTDLIEKVVADKTFSLDAMKAVEDLKTRFAKAEADRDRHKEELTVKAKQISSLENDLSIQNAKIKAAEAEIAALKAEQDKAKASISDAALQAAVAAAYKDALHTIFKPNAVRETIHRSTPVSVQPSQQCSGYVQNYMSTEDVLKEG
jgi:chromosome segregation ATPase